MVGSPEQLEEKLRRHHWRQVNLRTRYYTWEDAVERCRVEDREKRSRERRVEPFERFGDVAPARIDRCVLIGSPEAQ